MTTAKRLMTAEEFAQLPNDGRRLELVNGEVIELAPNNFEHSLHTLRTAAVLDAYVRPQGLGRVGVGDPGFLLRRNPDIVRAPDVAFITTGRLPDRAVWQSGFLSVIPDLVAEVVSPGDTAADVQQKVQEWLAAGVRLVLVLYPNTRSVVAYRSLTDIRLHDEVDTLDGTHVLPGFSCPVASLFDRSSRRYRRG